MTTTPTPNACCDSTDSLWIKIDQRVKDCKNNPNHCYWIDLNEGYALSPTNEKIPNLLVPTECIKGIECPTIWEHDTPNYWDLAWQKLAKEYLHSDLGKIGMAINSKDTRKHNQLHIHVRHIDSDVQGDLEQSDGKITTKPEQWKDRPLTISDPKAKGGRGHEYRVLRLNDLKQNLFKLLFDNVLKKEYGDKAAENMQYQTLVVAVRPLHIGGGFYILNSQSNMPNGVGDGERLLYPPPK